MNVGEWSNKKGKKNNKINKLIEKRKRWTDYKKEKFKRINKMKKNAIRESYQVNKWKRIEEPF